MNLPMLAEQQAIYDAGHCVTCRLYLDPEDRLYPPDAGGPWCERCWDADSECDSEESQWCDCGGSPYCPGPHRTGVQHWFPGD